jgi:hypothetical protein
MMNTTKAVIILALGTIVALMFMAAGANMMDLRSIGGTSVAEVFYQDMGLFVFAFGLFTGLLSVMFMFHITRTK